MTCASCASRIEKIVGELEGTQKVSVIFGSEMASISYDPALTSPLKIFAAIENLGFSVPRQKIVFPVEGMTCAACVSRVEKNLLRLDGVATAHVNLASERASVEYFDPRIGLGDFRSSLGKIGFNVPAEESGQISQRDREDERRQKESSLLAWKFGVSAVLSLLIFLAGMGDMLPFLSHADPAQNRWLLFLLATPVQFWAGWQFYKGAWTGFRHGYADMNTLIAVGTSAA